MFRITRIQTYTAQGAQSTSRIWQTAVSQPGWISRIALLTFLIVVGLPLMLLVLIALLFAVIVFTILAMFHGVWLRLRGAISHQDGRENVRIIRREE